MFIRCALFSLFFFFLSSVSYADFTAEKCDAPRPGDPSPLGDEFEYVVDPDGTGTYATIQGAVDDAYLDLDDPSDRGIVTVLDTGSPYGESVSIEMSEFAGLLIIQSDEGPEATIIEGDGGPCFEVTVGEGGMGEAARVRIGGVGTAPGPAEGTGAYEDWFGFTLRDTPAGGIRVYDDDVGDDESLGGIFDDDIEDLGGEIEIIGNIISGNGFDLDEVEDADRAVLQGGGVFLDKNLETYVEYNHIHGNRAHDREGSLLQNEIDEDVGGGAGLFARDSRVWIRHCLIESNSFYDSSITGNSMDALGGGVYFYRGDLVMCGNTIRENSATSGCGTYVAYHEGEVTVDISIAADLTVDSNSFLENVAHVNDQGTLGFLLESRFGAGLFVKTLRESSSSTTATDYLQAGDLLDIEDGEERGFLIINNYFVDNCLDPGNLHDDEVAFGGGLFLQVGFEDVLGERLIIGNVFDGNEAPDGGGGVYLGSFGAFEEDPDPTYFDNNTILDNSSSSGTGSGVFLPFGPIELSGETTLWGVASTGAADYTRYPMVIGANNIVWSNEEDLGEDLLQWYAACHSTASVLPPDQWSLHEGYDADDEPFMWLYSTLSEYASAGGIDPTDDSLDCTENYRVFFADGTGNDTELPGLHSGSGGGVEDLDARLGAFEDSTSIDSGFARIYSFEYDSDITSRARVTDADSPFSGSGIDKGAYELQNEDWNTFIRGDADGNGDFSALLDPTYLLRWGFDDGPDPPCTETADANNDGVLAPLPDALFLLAYAFEDGEEPPPPFDDCGLESWIGEIDAGDIDDFDCDSICP